MNMCLFSLCTLCQCHCTEILIADLGHKTCVCFHSIPCVSVTALRSLYRIWDMKHMSVFMLYLVSVSLHWDPHCGFGTWNTCLFYTVPCGSVTALRSSYQIWDMKHMSVFTLYLVSVSLHWDRPSRFGTWNTCLFHSVPCASITALRSPYWIWDVKHMSVSLCILCQYHCTVIFIPDLGHETRVCFNSVACVSVTTLRSS